MGHLEHVPNRPISREAPGDAGQQGGSKGATGYQLLAPRCQDGRGCPGARGRQREGR